MKRDLKSKVKMPAKKQEDMMIEEELEMDLAGLEMPEEAVAEDLLEEEDLDMADLEDAEPALEMLQDISDDDLLAEARARGLMADDELDEEEEVEEDELA